MRYLWIALLCLGCSGNGNGGEDHDSSVDVEEEDLAGSDDPGPGDGACVGLTGGSCHAITQCGCSGGEACQVLIDGETCEADEECVALTDDLAPGDDCVRSDQCRAGASCLSMGLPTRRCYLWCRTDADCPGTQCFHEVDWHSPPDSPTCPGETITPPYMACALP
jgi:hypothetical protein